MPILITGGAGFIGSHLTEALLSSGEEVHVLDNLSTGSATNLAACHTHPKFRFIEGTILDLELVDRCVREVETVYHLAAAVGVRLVVEAPLQTIRTNTQGTEHILQACASHRRKVILASTSEVYGRSTKPAFSENDDLILGPTSTGRWAYACTKALDEFMTFAYGKEHNLRFVILRYFNTIGPRQLPHHGMVVPRFMDQALKNEPITVFGDGQQSRCFIHVADAVEATLRAANTALAEGQVINIGNPQPIRILDLAQMVVRLTGSSSTIEQINPRELYDNDFEDMATRIPNISALQKITAFTPTRSLEQTLLDCLGALEKR